MDFVNIPTIGDAISFGDLNNGGASKDPSLSIGGGPSQYDDTKCIDFVTKLLKKHI